jgi:biopolymer transport protein TolQ
MNPVIQAFLTSDLFGKGIFLALFALSIATWSLFLQKWSLCKQILREGKLFCPKEATKHPHHPFAVLYEIFTKEKKEIATLDKLLSIEKTQIKKQLESGLYCLPTIVSLAPFLGLLGTVWGILITFNELQLGKSVQGSSAIMGGLSMALGTTVVGLIVAIPALVAYNYLRSQIKSICVDIDCFCEDLIAQHKAYE